MIDKHIIIDGVDVSGCRQYMHRYIEDYDIDTLDYCRYHFKPCKDVDVEYCYYKQFKRKEQELQEAMDNYVQLDLRRVKEYNELVDLYKAKEQECNKLYIQLKADEEYHKEEKNTLRKIIKNKEERNIELYKENNKLKQTLVEIKDYCNKYPQNSIGFKKYILQKISEVLND